MTLKVGIDFNRDGDYDDTDEDVTSRTRREGGLTLEYGRDQSTALAPTISGRGSVTLDNADRRFSPRNIASPLYGLMKPALPVLVTRTLPGVGGYIDDYTDAYSDLYGGDPYSEIYDELYSGTGTGSTPATYVLGRFHTDDSPINPDIDSKTVTLSLVDVLADFRGQTISTPLYAGIRTDQAIGYILDACGWTGERFLDPGATVIPWWWEDNTDALTALDKIVRSEGPPALLTVDTNGGIVFRNRHHRIIEAPSIDSQGTWRSTGSVEPVMQKPFMYDEAWRNVINSGTVPVEVRTPRQLQVVWTADNIIDLAPGETRQITVSGSDPFFNAQEPEDGTDFNTLSGSCIARLNRTSGAAVTITLHAVGAASSVSGLQLRAQPIQSAYTVTATSTDAASVADYGPRTYPTDLPWCGPGDTQSVLDTAVTMRAQPLPIISARFLIPASQPTKAGLLLARNLSDRVTVVEAETVLDDDFYIESIRHELTGEHDHAVTFGLEAAVEPVTPLLRFDDATAGFDLGLFGGGLDEAATVARWDTVGHGFDQGNFAH